MLDDWSTWIGPPRRSRRRCERRVCRKAVNAVWGPGDTIDADGSERVWVRNVSAQGVSLLATGERVGPRLLLDLSTPAGRMVVRGRVVRKRKVHEGFFEYGIEFVGRIASAGPEPPTDDGAEETPPVFDDVEADNFF